MTLDEFMNEQPDGDQIYYLAPHSAFVFIGTKAEYFSDIDMVSDDIINTCKARESYYRNLMVVSNARSRDWDSMHKTMQKLIKGFTPLRTRQIKDTYYKEDGGMVVKFEGEEAGRFWFRDEYDHMREVMKNDTRI